MKINTKEPIHFVEFHEGNVPKNNADSNRITNLQFFHVLVACFKTSFSLFGKRNNNAPGKNSTTKQNMMAKDEPLVTWRAFEDRSSRNSFCRKYPKFFGSHRAPWNKRMEWKKLKYESQMGYSNIYFFYWPNDFFKEIRQIVVGVSCNFYRTSHRLWLVICRRTTLVRDAAMI